ncbi:hypothetical protein [Roseovarius arcticus]|uniref:hypothetical protein n=1 Tax=Roseovarius arcticus TaxID=2547404 RepID=UPI00111071E0|nr:hypothetical protein [Roseovarius arcticus]
MSVDLHTRMLAAHARPDPAALIALYTEAADAANDLDASCFYLTHAYVFALEAGAPQARHLHRRLVVHGREE